MANWYNEDLAYIHDTGFRDYAHNSMPSILSTLQSSNISTGLIVDLGCGSGITSKILSQAGYEILGVDISADMIAIAQKRVPNAEFRVASLFTTEIPPCAAVISIGECLSYLFDHNSDAVLDGLFSRVYHALKEGSVFIFDVIIPGQVPLGETVKNFTEGQDWIVLVEKQEDLTTEILTRRIISLRQINDLYRRSEEVHHQRLFNPTKLTEKLQQIGFQVEITNCYGQFQLPPARIAVIARKGLQIGS